MMHIHVPIHAHIHTHTHNPRAHQRAIPIFFYGAEEPLTPKETDIKKNHDKISPKKEPKNAEPAAMYSFDQLKVLTGTQTSFLYCLQKLRLVANECLCELCGGRCELRKREFKEREAQYCWVCTCKRKPTFSRTILKHSYFEGKMYAHTGLH